MQRHAVGVRGFLELLVVGRVTAALPERHHPTKCRVDLDRGHERGRRLAAVEGADEVQGVAVLDPIAVHLDAAVAQVTRHRLLELAGLDEDVHDVPGEHLRAELLGALDVGLEQDRLLQVDGVGIEFLVSAGHRCPP